MSSMFQQVFQAQALFTHILLDLPNVVGVAAGYRESKGVITDEPAVVVLVQRKKPLAALSVEERVPAELDGIVTDVYEVGYLHAQQVLPGPREHHRPTIPGGVSIGHYKVTAGTLGAVVRDRTTGERLLLSNNHVLANSNEALVGDAILQPGATDGGKNPADVVAKLERFITLNYREGPVAPPAPLPPDPIPDPIKPPPGKPAPSGCDIVDAIVGIANLFARVSGSEKRVQAVASADSTARAPSQNVPDNVADCALARPLDTTMFTDQILNIGVVRQTAPPILGMRVRKFGRTSELTTSTITLLNATVDVSYDTSAGPRTGRFSGQVICGAMSQGGDSGSLVVDAATPRAVGLLFAGSTLATIFTPIDTVLNALNVEFGV